MAGGRWLTFVWQPGAERRDLLSDEDWQRVEWQLIVDPQAGDVIPGLNGARKPRMRLARRGKRGGARTIYLDRSEQGYVYFLATYAKNEQAHLTDEQQRTLRRMIEQLEQGD